MTRLKLKAEARSLLGRKVKRLRAAGKLPANLYGKKIKSIVLSIDAKEFEKVFKIAGETGLIDLTIGGKQRTVLVRNVQKDPLKEDILHVDFQEVDLKTKVVAQIPVELVGESPAEKQGLGTVVEYINEIEIEALPTDLPDKFEIDATKLVEVDQAILVKDIKVEKDKVEIKANPEEIIAKVEPPTKEEEVVPPAPAEGETPVEPGEKGTEEEKAKEELIKEGSEKETKTEENKK